MARFTVIYDACVLYPAPLRDLLIRLALTDLFKAHWTERIHDEWISSVLSKNPRVIKENLEKTRHLMNKNVLDSVITNYDDLTKSLDLPDENDNHVLAAAIKAGANAIVTFNLKDFPKSIVSKYDIETIHPDEFIYCQIDLSPALACSAIKGQRESLKNPPKQKEEFLTILQKQQLPQTVSVLREYIDLI